MIEIMNLINLALAIAGLIRAARDKNVSAICGFGMATMYILMAVLT